MLDQTLFPPFSVGGLTFSTYEYALEQPAKNRQSDDLYIRGSTAITDAKGRLVGRCIDCKKEPCLIDIHAECDDCGIPSEAAEPLQ